MIYIAPFCWGVTGWLGVDLCGGTEVFFCRGLKVKRPVVGMRLSNSGLRWELLGGEAWVVSWGDVGWGRPRFIGG